MSWWESPTVPKLFLIKSWTAEHIYMCVCGCRCQGWLMSRPVGILVTLHWPSDTRVLSGRRRGELNDIFLTEMPQRSKQGLAGASISPHPTSLRGWCLPSVPLSGRSGKEHEYSLKGEKEIGNRLRDKKRMKRWKREELTLCYKLHPIVVHSGNLHTKFQKEELETW